MSSSFVKINEVNNTLNKFYTHKFLGRDWRYVMKLSKISWQIRNRAFPANYT